MQQNDGATPAPPERAEDIPPETGKKNDSYDVAAADAAVAAGAGAQVFENEPQRGVKDACGGKKLKKAVGAEGFVCLVLVAGFFVAFGCVMGFSNAINTMFNTAFMLLKDTVFYLLALAVLMGAISAVLSEFGVVSLLNKAFAPLMGPLYGMPGATSISLFTSFLSDNPAVLTLANDRNYIRYFKKYQLGALTNIGTAFGMGLIVVVSMLSLNGEHFGIAVVVGLLSVFLTSILVTRLMLLKTKKVFGKDEPALKDAGSAEYDVLKMREVREGGVFQRLISSLLDGGAGGVKVGVSIIPGVLIIATLVLMLTNGKPEGGYTGGVGEGSGAYSHDRQLFKPRLKAAVRVRFSGNNCRPLDCSRQRGRGNRSCPRNDVERDYYRKQCRRADGYVYVLERLPVNPRVHDGRAQFQKPYRLVNHAAHRRRLGRGAVGKRTVRSGQSAALNI